MPEHNLSHELDSFNSFFGTAVTPVCFIVSLMQSNDIKNTFVNFLLYHFISFYNEKVTYCFYYF